MSLMLNFLIPLGPKKFFFYRFKNGNLWLATFSVRVVFATKVPWISFELVVICFWLISNYFQRSLSFSKLSVVCTLLKYELSSYLYSELCKVKTKSLQLNKLLLLLVTNITYLILLISYKYSELSFLFLIDIELFPVKFRF